MYRYNAGAAALFPVEAPKGALEPGMLVGGGYVDVHRTGRQTTCDYARLTLRDVEGLGTETLLRCRFAGHYLPVRSFLEERVRVVEIDFRPPGAGFLPLEVGRLYV